MTVMETIHISKHPLVAQKLSQLREKSLKPKEVRELTRDISLLLGYEASTDITLTKGHQVSIFKLYSLYLYLSKKKIGSKSIWYLSNIRDKRESRFGTYSQIRFRLRRW